MALSELGDGELLTGDVAMSREAWRRVAALSRLHQVGTPAMVERLVLRSLGSLDATERRVVAETHQQPRGDWPPTGAARGLRPSGPR